MTTQAAQTMPTLPRPYWKAGDVKDDYGNPYNETDLFTDDDMRAMYQQGYAAALAQTAGVAEGFVVVPARLTAENGAKGLLSGEFHERSFHTCDECDGEGYDDSGDACEVCDGSCTIEQKVTVSWDNIKAIHRRMVEHFAASIPVPSAASVGGVHPDALPDGTLSKSTAKRLAAASVSGRARDLLASVYEADGWVQHAADIRSGVTAKREVRALEQALTQQRGEAAAHASGVPGRVTDALVSTVEAAMHACYMDHDDYRLTTTLLHDMAVAAVKVVAATPQPSADAVREDSDRLDWIESQISKYGDGYTEPREAGFIIEWQQERPDHRWPGLRAWIDEERRRTSADELESLLSAASGEGVGK